MKKTINTKLFKTLSLSLTVFLMLLNSMIFNPSNAYADNTDYKIIAGNGTSGYKGDNGYARNAKLCFPNSIAVDKYGNTYIADTGNNVIRKVNSSGIIYTIAGNGIAGYKGDNGNAKSAELNSPEGVAVDKYGNIYIADTFNNVIRKINNLGKISTIAGTGACGYSGDGRKATAAVLNTPCDIFIDSQSNILIADKGNNVIRKISSNGTIHTIAGNGAAGFKGDKGPATAAELQAPWGVAADDDGNIYIADTGNNVIRQVDYKGIISTIAGSGIYGYSGDGFRAENASLNCPCNVKVDTFGNVLIADYSNEAIRKINSYGIISTIANLPSNPSAIALDNDDNIYVADTMDSLITVTGESDSVNNDHLISLKAGDYIQFGSYNNQPIEWKVLDINSNGILVTSDEIISLKAFDAAESGISGSAGGGYYTSNKDYQKFGSNTWGNSNIREWLNSDDDFVRYSTQPPTYKAVVYNCNQYDSEPGFLTNFTEDEINYIKTVRNSTLQGKTNIYTDDKVFLLSSDEWKQYLQYDNDKGAAYVTQEAIDKSAYSDKNLNPLDYWFYWLRNPYDYGNSSYLNYVYADGTVCHAQPNSAICGVRPAMYLKNVNFVVDSSQDGSKDNPYEIH